MSAYLQGHSVVNYSYFRAGYWPRPVNFPCFAAQLVKWIKKRRATWRCCGISSLVANVIETACDCTPDIGFLLCYYQSSAAPLSRRRIGLMPTAPCTWSRLLPCWDASKPLVLSLEIQGDRSSIRVHYQLVRWFHPQNCRRILTTLFTCE